MWLRRLRELIDFAELDGWASDDHAEALAVFRNTCMDFDEPDWQGLCAIAATAPDARTFFELFFRPVLIGGDRTRAVHRLFRAGA